MKQRFGELLALVLIVFIIGFIVYMVIPNNPKTPKPTPVTVRSTSKIVAQSHIAPVAAVVDQTPPNTPVLQEAAASNISLNSKPPVSQVTGKGIGKNKITKSIKQSFRQGGSAKPATVTSSSCAQLPKTISKVGSTLQSIPLIGGLLSDVTYCAS